MRKNETFDVGVVSGPHENCQLWRFEKDSDHAKGVHSLVAVESKQRVVVEKEGDNYAFHVESVTEQIDDQNQLFDVLMDVESEQGDIMLRLRGTNVFMCVKENVIYFLPESQTNPTRFILSVPKS